MTRNNTTPVLGSQAALSASNPAKVDAKVFKHEFSSLVGTTGTGGQFHLVAETGPVYPNGRDTVGVYGTGFKLVDFCTTDFISKYDYFRVLKIEYLAALANVPRQSVPNVMVYSSVDWDNASVTSFSEFMKRPNKALTVLTSTAPTQRLLEFVPRRRISSNADPSLQLVPNPTEWIDCAYASNVIFGNVKFGVCCPDGQTQYQVTDQCHVLVTSKIWVEFKGRIGA